MLLDIEVAHCYKLRCKDCKFRQYQLTLPDALASAQSHLVEGEQGYPNIHHEIELLPVMHVTKAR